MNLELLAGKMAETKLAGDHDSIQLRFDPDRRIDIKNDFKSFRDSTVSMFDPDQRIEEHGKARIDRGNKAEFDPDKRVEIQDTYYTTYNERLERTPQNECDYGMWTGERGESKFIPAKEETRASLKEYNLDGIEYKDANPDFSVCSEIDVEIDMTQYRQSTIDKSGGKRIVGNFEKADAKCAEQWNEIEKDGKSDWTARDVSEWRGENKYTWHECSDRKTCNLVPRSIHEECKHSGGVAECKRRDMINAGGGFDE